MSALVATGLTLRRGGRTVLHDASVTFVAGQLTAVIGPNGAGKSSLLLGLAGLLPPTEGKVLFDRDMYRDMPRRELARRRGYLPQSPRVEWPISVARLVALGLLPFGGPPGDLVDRAIADCGLEALRDRPATDLSGGELARAMLARATVGDPELLIVDEPTAGLDPRHAIDAMRRLRSRAEAGRTVIVAIHDLDLAARFADHVVGLKGGRMLLDAPAAEGFAETPLGELYDIPARVRRDPEGVTIRFVGE